MKQKEKELFISLCSFNDKEFDEDLLSFATPTVLGHLFFNRMSAIAYGTLKKHNLLGKVNREFRNSLKSAYIQSIEKNNSFFQCVELLEIALSCCDCTYAMLKGAYLCKTYPDGYRTSNDIDLLVSPNDVTKIGAALTACGFKQGNLRNDEFIPATRKEIIESKMMRGETVPYIMEVNLPWMKYLEVDINFSLDYKPGDTKVLNEILNNVVIEKIDDLKIHTLSTFDFLIHLCCHLYKEATTLPWVEMNRDMTLYKYCDIYMLLNDATGEYIDLLFNRAQALELEKICAFAIIQMSEIFKFNNIYAITKANKVLGNNTDFIHTVISPKDKKEYVYSEKNILKRFFLDERKKLLKEVKDNEKAKYEA